MSLTFGTLTGGEQALSELGQLNDVLGIRSLFWAGGRCLRLPARSAWFCSEHTTSSNNRRQTPPSCMSGKRDSARRSRRKERDGTT
jgi:hypothetical protein